MNKRDILLLIGGLILLTVLLMAPDETTKHLPKDDNHQKFYTLVKKDGKTGKKAAEKFCQDCHNEDQVAFSADHPPKLRCLFCHKVDK